MPLSYSGTVTLTASTANTTSGKGYYQHSGLLIGAPRFTIIADESTCTSTGKLVLNVDGEVKNSNDMAELFTWGGDLFGASRDTNYTNKSYSLTYTG